YYDQAGFGSIATTYKDAKKKDASITMQDVKEWFQENVERKKQLSGYNSFIAPESFWEFQFELFFINDLPNQKFKVGTIMIDVFSKYMVVIPIKSKNEGDVASALIEGFNKMGKLPKLLYTDDETSLSSKSIQEYLKKEGVEHYVTRGHANVSERAIRTFKDMLYKRVERDEKLKKENIQWTDYVPEILLTYNNKQVHSSHRLSPNEARKPQNHFSVKMQLELNRIKTRKYPNLRIGDEIKIFRKKGITEKERNSTWSVNKYKIEKIEQKLGQDYYYVEGVSRPYLRSEILKV
ncbi:MAG: transposase family protein, partial [bacterium]|nr:transposase family protein [bacterium]